MRSLLFRGVLILCFWGLVACGDSVADLSPCDGSSISTQSTECLTGLRERCLAIEDEAGCVAAESLHFGETEVQCRWSRVVSVGDAATCSDISVKHRCEAVALYWFNPCGSDACVTPSLSSAFNVLPTAPNELVDTGCGGPLGPWAKVGYVRGPDEGVCADNVTPAAPALCDCAVAACTALAAAP